MLWNSESGPMHSHKCLRCGKEWWHSDRFRMSYPRDTSMYDRLHQCPICGEMNRNVFDESPGDLFEVVPIVEVRKTLRAMSQAQRDILFSVAPAISGIFGEVARRLYYFSLGMRTSVFPEFPDISIDAKEPQSESIVTENQAVS